MSDKIKQAELHVSKTDLVKLERSLMSNGGDSSAPVGVSNLAYVGSPQTHFNSCGNDLASRNLIGHLIQKKKEIKN